MSDAVLDVRGLVTVFHTDAGPVRAPLTDLKPAEMEELKVLIDKLGPQ